MQNDNTPLLKAFFQSNRIRAILVLDIIAILIIVFIFARQSSKASIVSFNIAPIDAKISVNGDTHYRNGQYYISPGKYKVTVSHDGLEPKSITVNIESRDFASVNLFLAGTDNNFEFYKQRTSYDSYKKLKTIASAGTNVTTDNDTTAQEFIANYDKVLSISDQLPIKGYVHADPNINASSAGFAIRSGLDDKECNTSSCLVVKFYGSGFENEVRNKIQNAGYNPDDYQIIYRRYE